MTQSMNNYTAPQTFVYCPTCDGQHYTEDGVCKEPLKPRKAYDIRTDEESSTYRMAIFSRKEVEAAYGIIGPEPISERKCESLIARLTGWYRSYGGPGCGFSSEPSIRVWKRNIVVTQVCGLDI